MLGGLDYRSITAAVSRALSSLRIGASQIGSSAVYVGAQGRLTLTSATPVTTGDVTGATTVYFTPYKGNKVELYDGAGWTLQTFTELSQATTDTTKSPAAVANNSNYDLFVWGDAGTLRCTRGPAWSSDTARGTGAGTTELEVLEGRYVNKIAITNGPAARRGLYVGTIRSDGSAQINDSLAKRHVWSNYNRVARPMRALEGAASWTYTSLTTRQANANAANQLDMVRGLDEDAARAEILVGTTNSSMGIVGIVGVGLDSTSAIATTALKGVAQVATANQGLNASSSWSGFPGLGRHYLAWLETVNNATGTQVWYGINGNSALYTAGISGEVMA